MGPVRSWSLLTEEERVYLVNGPGTLAARCREVGAHYHSVANALARRQGGVVSSKAPTYSKPARLCGDVLVLADPHVPYHDADLTNRALLLAKRWQIEFCVLAGDLVDLTMLSPFEPDVPVLPLEEELEAAEEFLGQVARQFKRVLYIKGNHDVRLYKRLLQARVGAIRADRLWSFWDNVESSAYHWCLVESGGQVWQIEHPASYSKNPGVVGNELAARFLHHMVIAHSHMLGVRRDRSGRFTIIDSGGLFHPAKLAYAALVHRARPEMNQGFVVIRRGRGYLFDPANVDWEWWLEAAASTQKGDADGSCQSG